MKYAKAIVGIVIAAGGALAGVLVGDQSLSDLVFADWLVVIGAALGSGALVAWVSKAQAAKAIVAGLGAMVASLSLAVSLDNVVSASEWITAAVAGLAAWLLVYETPNAEEPAPTG